MGELGPSRRLRELAGLGQIIGEQRHRQTKDGVGEGLQAPHFELVVMGFWHAGRTTAHIAITTMSDTNLAGTIASDNGRLLRLPEPSLPRGHTRLDLRKLWEGAGL